MKNNIGKIMRVRVFAVGRMKAGPERDLVDRYFGRFSKAGQAVGLEFSGVNEIMESHAATPPQRKQEEAQPLYETLDGRTHLILLDECGKTLSSQEFAEHIRRWRDNDNRHLILALGGPDGHDPGLRTHADLILAFGMMTWPHQIARILVAEQLYRVVTILSGHPYHRI